MTWKKALAVVAFLFIALTLWMHRSHYERVGDTHVVRINRITGEAYLLRGGDGWVAFENLSGTASSTTEQDRSASSEESSDTLTSFDSVRRTLQEARDERLASEGKTEQTVQEQKSGALTRGSLSFSSILLPVVVGFLLRFYFGRQKWYFGVLFFVTLYPFCLVGLVGLYLNLGMSGNTVLSTAGSNSMWGAAIGAVLLSSGWFGSASDKLPEDDE